jgi:hypothetical protein
LFIFLQYHSIMGVAASATLEQLDPLLQTGDVSGGLDFLAERFRSENEWPLVFEARLMKKRLELGLPLVLTQDASEFPPATRASYEEAMVAAAREVGHGFLSMGNIGRAWPYFRAIGELAPMVEAVESVESGEQVETAIAIAFQEGVHPSKGLGLILHEHGMCRALTAFGMQQVQKDRDKCIALLVRALHAEILLRMGSEIAARDGAPTTATSLIAMMADRDDLFGPYDYYVDTSHLLSLLPYSLEVSDKEILGLFHELCEYGQRLAPCFQPKGDPPFENPGRDYGQYVLAMLGDDVDSRIAHFRKIAEDSVGDTNPAQFLVNLLVRLERYSEALDVSLKFLGEERQLSCPTAIQLCRMASDFDRLKQLARERNDLLSYVAAFEGRR